MASGANKNFGTGSGTGTSNTSGTAASHSQHQSRHHQSSRSRGSHSHHHHHHKPKHSIHWFRKGLRLSDNPALRRAMTNSDTWRCIFILDPWFAGSSNQGVNKWRFLLQCLEDLDQSLRKLNSRLYVVRGQPADALPNLFKQWNTTYLSFEEDPEPYGRVRDQNIMAMCKEMGIKVVTEKSHTLYDLNKVIEANDGKAPATYRQFINIISSMKPPATPVPNVCSKVKNYGITPIAEDHDDHWGVPTLAELGFDMDCITTSKWHGGETEALNRLDRHLERKAWVASFGRPKMTPQSLYASPAGLSPYLRFGCLSTRLFYHMLANLYRKIKETPPPMSTFGQLLWREFFYTASTKNPNFDQMDGNPICVQIPWEDNPEVLAKWASAKTGFPWIDAIMTQLREEGWIHQVARHSVACFLTRGHLWISWVEGMKVFDELLLDADWSVNAGSWMWLSCSSFFTQFFPLYDPVRFGRKADPNGDYIRKYVPVLKNFPIQYIHEPWMAPEQIQRAAKCIVGTDYPKPMIEHESAGKINQERMKQVYQQLSTYRNSNTPEVQDQPVNSQEQSQATYVSKYSDDGSLTLQQKKEQQELMPAPNHPVSGGFHKQDQYPGQDEYPESLEIDALTPSINNYQPQVVSDTLERDAASFLNSTPHQQLQMQNSALFHTQYIIGDEHNQNTSPVKK